MSALMADETLGSGEHVEDATSASAAGSANLSARTVLGPVRRALRWAWREILLALLAAFIVGLGAGAAEALISWATS